MRSASSQIGIEVFRSDTGKGKNTAGEGLFKLTILRWAERETSILTKPTTTRMQAFNP
jgi:hypothetical protein